MNKHRKEITFDLKVEDLKKNLEREIMRKGMSS